MAIGVINLENLSESQMNRVQEYFKSFELHYYIQLKNIIVIKYTVKKILKQN